MLIVLNRLALEQTAVLGHFEHGWTLKLRDFLVGERALLEMVVYAGLPPAMTEWQAERDRKNKFLHWLGAHGLAPLLATFEPLA